MAGTITISSSYGASGDPIGREVARRLAIPFHDRAIPVAVARDLAIDPGEALAKDWRAPTRMERFLRAMTTSSPEFGLAEVDGSVALNSDRIREATENVVRGIADGDGGVILGRASMVILRGRPDVLCVRLDADAEARIRHVVEVGFADEPTARREQRETDDAREDYGRIFYGVRQDDQRLYHLILDPTEISPDACIDIILRAVQDRLGLTVDQASTG